MLVEAAYVACRRSHEAAPLRIRLHVGFCQDPFRHADICKPCAIEALRKCPKGIIPVTYNSADDVLY